MPPDVSPIPVVERHSYPSLPKAPGFSIIPQAATALADDVTRGLDTCYARATGTGLVLTGFTHPPVSIPTIPLPFPSFPSAAEFPTNWIRIPQRIYNYGHKQFDFKRLGPIIFSTKDHLGINLGDAYRKNCTRLNGRDDPMLPGISGVISCRLLVGNLLALRHE